MTLPLPLLEYKQTFCDTVTKYPRRRKKSKFYDLILITSVPIVRHDIGKKIFFNVLKKTRVIKKIKDFKFGAKKNYKQRFIHSLPATSGVQTLHYQERYLRKNVKYFIKLADTADEFINLLSVIVFKDGRHCF